MPSICPVAAFRGARGCLFGRVVKSLSAPVLRGHFLRLYPFTRVYRKFSVVGAALSAPAFRNGRALFGGGCAVCFFVQYGSGVATGRPCGAVIPPVFSLPAENRLRPRKISPCVNRRKDSRHAPGRVAGFPPLYL